MERRPDSLFGEGPLKAEDEYDDEDDFILSMFDHEKLDVYQLSLHFLTWVTPLL